MIKKTKSVQLQKKYGNEFCFYLKRSNIYIVSNNDMFYGIQDIEKIKLKMYVINVIIIYSQI